MGSNLYQANAQWSTRPDDERFWTLEEMKDNLNRRHLASTTMTVPFGDLRAASDPTTGDVVLTSPAGDHAAMTNWSFGQLCSTIEAPAHYLTTLPADTTVGLVNYGIQKRLSQGMGDRKTSILLQAANGNPVPTVRALTSTRFSRAWDDDLVDRLIELRDDKGWQTPPARPSGHTTRSRKATEADVLAGPAWGLSIKVGDEISPAGLYAGDRDMFCFMVNERNQIDAGNGDMMSRGFFLQNSEVGAKTYDLTCFLYRHVCGNHIVWDASMVTQLKIRHIGKANLRMGTTLTADLTGYVESGAKEQEAAIQAAKNLTLGDDRREVIERVYKMGVLPQKALIASYDRAEQDGENPRSVWGFVQGITRQSQSYAFADARVSMDRAAGKLLKLAAQ